MALWDEMEQVLKGCGLDPETCGRKMRAAVLGALKLSWEQTGWPLANVGDLAIGNSEEYRKMGPVPAVETRDHRLPQLGRVAPADAVAVQPRGTARN